MPDDNDLLADDVPCYWAPSWEDANTEPVFMDEDQEDDEEGMAGCTKQLFSIFLILTSCYALLSSLNNLA